MAFADPPPLDRNEALQLLSHMISIRRFEEKAAELYSLGRIHGFLHLYIGEEAVAAGAIPVLGTEDAIVSTYREHGHALVRGTPMGALMAELYGKATGCSRGRGGSMHFFDVARRFYGGHAIVGAGIPFAVGLALSDKLSRRERVTACFFGDGAVDEGEFHESCNLAALWSLPVLFLCENNFYAMGTALARHQAQVDLALKARSYRMDAATVDGMDAVAVKRAVTRDVVAVRSGGGPRFLELQTYRFRGHSMADPELYRDGAEVERWKAKDPIATFTARILREGLSSDADVAAIEERVALAVRDAVAFAEQSPWEPVSDLSKHVTWSGPPW